MRGFIEAAAFLGIAAALHLGGGLVLQGRGGADSAGARGDALMSLEAAPESFAALAMAWRRAPDAATAADAPTPPAGEGQAPGQVDPRAADPNPISDISTPSAPLTPRPETGLPAPAPVLPDLSVPDPPAGRLKVTQPPPAPTGTVSDASAPAMPSAPRSPSEPDVPQASLAPPPALVTALSATDGQQRPQPRPEPRPEPAASAPRPAQTARGAGGGAAAGLRADAPAATLSEAERRSHLASWGGAIRNRIEQHRQYPVELRGQRAEGTAIVQLVVARNGQLLSAGIARSSGHGALDSAALGAVRRAGGFPAAPAALSSASYRFDLPVAFRP